MMQRPCELYNRFNAGSIYIRHRTRGRRIYPLCQVSAYIAFLRLPVAGVSSLSFSQLIELHSLASQVHAYFLRAAAYFHRYTFVIVYYTRYKLVQLAFAELSPSSRCIPFHSLAECSNRRTSLLQQSHVFAKNTVFFRLQLTRAFLRVR